MAKGEAEWDVRASGLGGGEWGIEERWKELDSVRSVWQYEDGERGMGQQGVERAR